MASSYAKVMRSVWSDDDFRALSPRGQHLFLLLISQPQISYAGHLAYTPKRWAKLSNGCTPEEVEHAIAELEVARFVVRDVETDELLIRTYPRNDGVTDSPNLVVALWKAWAEIVSPKLRAIVARELPEKVFDGERFPEPPPELVALHHDETAGQRTSEPVTEPIAEPIAIPSRNPSRIPSENPSPKGSGTTTPTTTPTPPPAARTPGGSSPPYASEFTDWWAEYPRRVERAAAAKAYAARRRDGATAADLLAACRSYAASVKRAGTEQRFIKHAKTFLAKDGPWTEWLAGTPPDATPALTGSWHDPDALSRRGTAW
jgi:hypothetical protein